MAIAKVQFKENASATPEVWMDTTQKTVTANTMLDGTTALKNDGTGITGNIISKSSSDLTASGATVTAPAGYYPSAASKSVASGSASTPATSITANPTISVNASGLITASVSGSQSVTPSVSAGYVSAGTAGTVSVSGSKTQQLSTQAATTITPSTNQQTAVAAGKYTTGAVTVDPIPSQYIIPSGTKEITANGEGIDVSAYASVDVAVPSSAPNLQEKTVTPSDQTQVITADSGAVDVLASLNNIDGGPNGVWNISWAETPVVGEVYHITLNGTRAYRDRTYSFDDDVEWTGFPFSFDPTVTPKGYGIESFSINSGNTITHSVSSDEETTFFLSFSFEKRTPGYDALSKVTVNPIPSAYIIPTGTIQITQNGTVDVTQYANANVNVTDGTTASENDVNFIDYDGTILYSYTASDFANLSVLPANPSHAGLTAQGWNWSLSDAKTYVTQHGKLWIGQMYITSDGKTRIYITLDNSNYLSPYLAIAVNGTVEVDWGDNSSTDTITGTSNTTLKYTLHEYASTGDYVIAITVTSGSFSFYGSNNVASLFRTVANANDPARNRIYSSSATHIRLGNQALLGQYAFYNCQGIKSIAIPSSISSFGNYAFRNCYSLTSLTIPLGLTNTGLNLLQACYNLTSVAIPNTVTTIGSYFASDCVSLPSITLPNNVTAINSYAFNSCYNLSSIEVPSSSLTFGTYAFYNCVLIPGLTIVYGATTIPSYMFGYCYALKNITIPASITNIAANAFGYCYSIKEYHFLSTTPPTLASTSAFTGIQSDTKIYVPYSADHSVLEAYKTATNWSTYASRMEEEPQ